MIHIRLILLTSILLTSQLLVCAQEKEYYPDPDPAINRRIDEWKELKFGLLMHWGTYSQWGIVESWSICPEDLSWASGAHKAGVAGTYNEYVTTYEGLKNTFNPTRFNPSEWAEAAKDAGMKYVIFTTKHHDGFCMFDSKYTDYKITDSACPFSRNPQRNVAKEVFNAFRAKNFWVGAYFSKPDWHSDYYWWKKFPATDRNCNYSIAKHPAQWNLFKDYTYNQLNELMSDYGKMDILWLDGGWVRKKTPKDITEELAEEYEGSRFARNPQSQDLDMPELVKQVRKKQAQLIVVDRAVPGEQQNYLTPEQHIPENGLPYPWETCMTMANSWSYVPNDTYKPANELIEKLVDIVSKGGNLLLNIGPSPDGTLADTAYSRLKEIGAWMNVHGEAIYGTTMCSAFGEGDHIRFTQSKDGKTRYIFLFDVPKEHISITKMSFTKGTTLTLLGNNLAIPWKQTDKGIDVNFSSFKDTKDRYVWVLKVKEK